MSGRCNRKEIYDLLVQMVNAPSYPGILRQEEKTVKSLSGYLISHGLVPVVTEVEEGRPNLIVSIEGEEPGPHILLCGHTDTVPPNDRTSSESYLASERNGRLYGRGTADMKGALAAMAGAMVYIRKSGGLKRGKVSLAAVIDEEMKSLGTESLILNGFKADAAIVGEPTDCKIAIGNRGLEWLRVDFKGRSTHGGTPESGINAISAAARFIYLVENELLPGFQSKVDPVLGLPAINIGTIAGGDQPSTVAGFCRVELDRRWISSETVEEVFNELETLLNIVRSEYRGLKTEISRIPGGMATMIHGPVTIDPTHPLVLSAKSALSDFNLPADPLVVVPGWTDASLLSREAGIPTIIWGPGEINCAHSPEESIKLEDLYLAAEMYVSAVKYFTEGS